MSSRPSSMASVPVTSSEISSPTAPKFTTRLPSISSAVPSSPSRSVSFPCLYGPNSPSSCLHDISTSSDGAPVAVLRSIIIDAADLSQTDHDCASYHCSFRNSLFPISKVYDTLHAHQNRRSSLLHRRVQLSLSPRRSERSIALPPLTTLPREKSYLATYQLLFPHQSDQPPARSRQANCVGGVSPQRQEVVT